LNDSSTALALLERWADDGMAMMAERTARRMILIFIKNKFGYLAECEDNQIVLKQLIS
jgi:hypothetical protein